MVHLDLSGDAAHAGTERAGRARRAAILALALLLTVATFAAAFLIGAAYFQSRRYSVHRQRLERLLIQSPTLDQVTQGLRDDGSPLLASPAGPAELRALVARFRGQKLDEILAKARRWPVTRVFRASDMVYFIYFDETGTMRDFTCVSA